MAAAIATGVFLVFVGRLLCLALRRSLQERGRLRPEDPDPLGVFLSTMGVAIALWFALDVVFRWHTPLPWRLAAICAGFLMAEGATSGRKRRK